MLIQRNYTHRGFTIVELLVVIVVIAILASISIVSYLNIQDRAHAAATVINVKAYVGALRILDMEEGAIFEGDGCIGGSAQSTPCSLSMRYEGSDCTGYENVSLGERNTAFDTRMEKILGRLPEQVVTKPYETRIQVSGTCTGIYGMQGATYQSYKSLRVLQDGTVESTYSSAGGNNQAWAVTYVLLGEDANCTLPDSYVQSGFPGYTTCAVVGGNVTYL